MDFGPFQGQQPRAAELARLQGGVSGGARAGGGPRSREGNARPPAAPLQAAEPQLSSRMDVAIHQQQPIDMRDLFASLEAGRGAPAAQPVRPQAQLAQPPLFDLAGMQASVFDSLLPDLHFPDLPPLANQALGGGAGGLALASFEQLQAFMQQPLGGGGGKHMAFPQGEGFGDCCSMRMGRARWHHSRPAGSQPSAFCALLTLQGCWEGTAFSGRRRRWCCRGRQLSTRWRRG